MSYHMYLFLLCRAGRGSSEELAFVFCQRRRFLFLLIDVDALFLRGDADSPDVVADAPHTGTPPWCHDGASWNCMQGRQTADAITVSNPNMPIPMTD